MGKSERLSLYLLIAVSAALYIFIGYFLERSESTLLISAYVLLFGCYLWLIYKAVACSTVHFIFVGLAFRLLLLLAMPNLSDDIFRFIWDGKLLGAGIDPFAELPATYMEQGDLPAGLTEGLFEKLNSPNYFTIYPPVAQFIFFLSTEFSPQSVLGSAIIMRLLIILAEVGTLFYLSKLILIYKAPKTNILWYALNPLVILELTGNLHFEAFMIFFLVAAIFFFIKSKLVKSALFFALAVAAKLIPLMFLPVMLRRMKWKSLLRFYGFTALFIVLLFAPLLTTGLIEGMGSSISLYFQKFEFNASLYYIIREIGYAVKGYNVIGAVGPYMALVLFVSVMGFSLIKYKLSIPKTILVILMLYLGLATTVHPWYVTTLLAISVLTRYKFVMIWTFFIFLTYIGYTQTGYKENLWFVAIEYVVVIVYMLYEIFQKDKSETIVECA